MKLQENFKAFIDGELPAGRAAEVRHYLDLHPEARSEVEELELLSKSIRAYVSQPEPVGLSQTLDKLAARKSVKAPWLYRPWMGPALVTVCLGIVCVAVFFPVFAQSKVQGRRIASATFMDSSSAPAASQTAKSMDESKAANSARNIVGRGGFTAGKAANGSFGGGFSKRDANGSIPWQNEVRTGGGNAQNGTFGSSSRDSAGEAHGARFQDGLSPRTEGTATVTSPATRQPLVQKEASLGIKVKDLANAQQAAEGIAIGNGGFVAESNREEVEGEDGAANLTLRVPVQRFDAVIRGLRALGDVVSDSSTGTDVTGDVVDMDARLKVLKAEESDYMVLLGRARSIAAIMEIKDKLTSIREEIESITSERRDTKDRAVYSTINVNLTKVKAPKPPQAPQVKGEPHDTWFADSWKSSTDGLSSAGKFFAQILIFTLVWSPIWVPFALLGMWLAKRMKW